MSVDLLRRAAVVLREHAEAASHAEDWTNDGWEIYDGPVGTTWIAETCAGDLQQDTANGSYITLLHPPVALALSEWLDVAAKAWEIDFSEPPRNPRDRAALYSAVAAARAVLREPAEVTG
jgi:hypothetical protein